MKQKWMEGERDIYNSNNATDSEKEAERKVISQQLYGMEGPENKLPTGN